jgi:hypothetical protein
MKRIMTEHENESGQKWEYYPYQGNYVSENIDMWDKTQTKINLL